ncbi:MAG: hypothetical protein RIG61_07150 [Deltaproteobacteria bacterium]
MALSVLMVYEPVSSTREKENYWRSYISFYEKFWDRPATPQSSWYGSEYDQFRGALAEELGLDKKEIQDCFFMKDAEGNYYVVPVGSKVNLNIFSAENFIPLEWFLMYEGGEKKYFYTHTGFGAIHQDAIYYTARIEDASHRLKEAAREIDTAIAPDGGVPTRSLSEALTDIKRGILNITDWLSGFNAAGYVLLNYGEICSHIEPDSMKNEDSVSELRHAIRLAGEGKHEEAETSLRILLGKWDEIQRAASGDKPRVSSTLQ